MRQYHQLNMPKSSGLVLQPSLLDYTTKLWLAVITSPLRSVMHMLFKEMNVMLATVIWQPKASLNILVY